MDREHPVKELEPYSSEHEEEEEEEEEQHKTQLERLKEKDPEFYRFLQEHNKELLEFNDDDVEDDDVDTEADGGEQEIDGESSDLGIQEEEEKPSLHVVTSEMVESWCNAVQQEGRIGALRNLMKAFRVACHYGDDGGNESSMKFAIMSSHVFNKIMLFVLNEMDRILRNLLGLPSFGGKQETIKDLTNTKKWKNYNHLVKSYLGNALHVLNEMTDAEMVAFTLRRLKSSSVFLAAFPSLLRKYIKVALHFWGTGGGPLPIVSFLFLRDLCIRLGSDCFDECFKGIYKAYVLNCPFVNAVKLQHIQFLRNCVVELLCVDLPAAYQHAFVFIRQLAMILRDAITMKTKESFRKVYEWKFINCLELWTDAICAYGSEADFRPLAYPLTQIISGVARLVPTARYLPLRLRCIRMLNRIAASTGTYIPVSMLLLDMLEMGELNRPPTGGVGKAIDMRTILKVNKATLKTRAFQEACVSSVVEELAEHLAQWSYSVAFFELAFIPAVRLRNFAKSTKADRFRKEIRQLIRQIEANSRFTNQRRMSVTFLPNDPAAASFLEAEKKSGSSPLSRYVSTLRQRAQQRNDSLLESSVIVGEHSSFFSNKIPERVEDEEDDVDNDKGAVAFGTDWLPGGKSKAVSSEESEKKKKKRTKKKRKNEYIEPRQEGLALDEDIVEDLMLSSDEDDDDLDTDENTRLVPAKLPNKKQKPTKKLTKKKPTGKASKIKSSTRQPSSSKGENAHSATHKLRRLKSPTKFSTKNLPSDEKKSMKRKRSD